MAAKRKRETAVSWKKRRIQRKERKTLKMKRRRKCVYLEWMERKRCVERGVFKKVNESNVSDNILCLTVKIEASSQIG